MIHVLLQFIEKIWIFNSIYLSCSKSTHQQQIEHWSNKNRLWVKKRHGQIETKTENYDYEIAMDKDREKNVNPSIWVMCKKKNLVQKNKTNCANAIRESMHTHTHENDGSLELIHLEVHLPCAQESTHRVLYLCKRKVCCCCLNA